MEALAATNLTPEATAHIILANLSTVRMTVDQRVFWMKVADELGPDWIEELGDVVAFMRACAEHGK